MSEKRLFLKITLRFVSIPLKRGLMTVSAKEGWLTKQGGMIKTWKKRWFSLQGKMLYYYEKPGKKEQGAIDLADVSEVEAAPDCKKQPAFKLTVPGESRTYYIVAESKADCDSWVEMLKKAKSTIPTTASAGAAAASSGGSGTAKVRYEDFDVLKVIGRGTYGKVELARSKVDHKLYAIKVMEKKLLEETDQVGQTIIERDVLLKLVHPFLVGAHSSFQSPQNIYLVLDYVPGGELFGRLRDEGKFSESRTRLYTAELALGLGFLHSKGFIYRDLKPENILVEASGHLRITDFGLAKGQMSGAGSTTTTFCGTPEYIAPEMLQQQPYTKSVDWWSLGILVFEMLNGLPPFYDENTNKMYRMILQDAIQFPAGISPNAKDFITLLLDRCPSTRLGAGEADVEELKRHPFLSGLNWDEVLAKTIKPEWVPDIKGEGDTHLFDSEFTEERAGVSGKEEAYVNPETQLQFQGFTSQAESEIPE
jgi:serine/threonine protein kinase